jgi:hypothetical protein
MQFCVDFIREKRARSTPLYPGILEGVEPFAATFGTRSVTCGKRHGLIQEEELCVTARRHHRTSPVLKLQETSNPAPAGVLTDDFAIVIVNGAAPVSHERSTSNRSENGPAGVHTVL